MSKITEKTLADKLSGASFVQVLSIALDSTATMAGADWGAVWRTNAVGGADVVASYGPHPLESLGNDDLRRPAAKVQGGELPGAIRALLNERENTRVAILPLRDGSVDLAKVLLAFDSGQTPAPTVLARLEVLCSFAEAFAAKAMATEALEYRKEAEGLITSIAARLIRLGTDDVNDGLTYALEQIGLFAQVDRSYIFLLSEDGKTQTNTHEWCAPGISAQIDELQDIPLEPIPWWAERVRDKKTIHIPRVADLPPEAAPEKEVLAAQSIQSLVVVPLVHGDRSIGFIGFDSVRAEKVWPREDVALLETLSALMSGVLEYARTEDALRGTEQWLKLAMDGANLGLWDFDAQANVIRLSDSLVQILGEPHEPMWAPEQVTERIHPDDVPALTAAVEAHFREETSLFELQLRYLCGQDRWIWLLVRGKASARTASGPPSRVVGTALDITEQKWIEEELRRGERLRTLSLLAGGIAHDFNNILTGVMGNVSLAKLDASPGSDAGQVLTDAEQACLRASDLTQQLLTFTKAGTPVKKTASIREVVHNTTVFALRGSNVAADLQVDPDLWPVDVDLGQISQVINNLVINADQAMPKGGKAKVTAKNERVTAQSGLSLPPGRYVKVSVKDEGVGIPPEHLERIFEPYFTTKQRGSGLGLATSFSIVARHEGLITVESKPGQGACFVLYLKAAEGEPAQVSSPQAPPASGEGRILVMDDEGFILNVATRMLMRLGFHVTTSKDGQEAVRQYARSLKAGKPFDAVILDLTVRDGMGGQEAVEQILAIDPDAKCVVSSGYSKDPVMAEHERYGFRAVLAKPYEIRSMGDVLGQLMRSTEPSGAGAASKRARPSSEIK